VGETEESADQLHALFETCPQEQAHPTVQGCMFFKETLETSAVS